MSGQKSLLDFWTPKRKRDDSAEPKQKRSAKKTKTHVSTSRLDKAASASKKARSDIHKATVFKEKQVDAAANDDPRPADSSPIPGKDAIPSGSQLTIAPSTPRKKPLANSATYPSMPRTRKALHRAPTIIPETPQHIRDPPTPVTSNDINQTSPTRNKVALRSFSSLPSSFDDSEVIPSSQSQYIVFPSMPHRTSDPAESNSQLNSDEIVATSQSQEHDSDYAEYWKNRSPAKTKQASARNSSSSPTFKRPLDPVDPWERQDALPWGMEGGDTTVVASPSQRMSFTQQSAATESDLDFEEWAEESRRERLKELDLLVSPRKQFASAKTVGESQSSIGSIPDAVNDFFNDLGDGSYPPDFPESLRF